MFKKYVTAECLFMLFFDDVYFVSVYKSSNEVAESICDPKPAVFCYYQSMTCDDFHKLLGILIYLGY